MTTWQEHKEHGLRMVAVANTAMGLPEGDMGEVPLEALGERPVWIVDGYRSDHTRLAEEEFNALVALEVQVGRVSEEVGVRAVANFHDFARASQLTSLKNQPGPQASPRFYQ